MTQFQESASVRTLGTPRAADTGALPRDHGRPRRRPDGGGGDLVRATGRPSDAAISGTADSAAVDGYLAGLTAANKQHQLEGAALAMRRPITATDGQQRLAARSSCAMAGRRLWRCSDRSRQPTAGKRRCSSPRKMQWIPTASGSSPPTRRRAQGRRPAMAGVLAMSGECTIVPPIAAVSSRPFHPLSRLVGEGASDPRRRGQTPPTRRQQR